MKKLFLILGIIILLLALVITTSIIWYNTSIKNVSNNTDKIKVEIEIGSSTDVIAQKLEDLKYMRN